MNYVDVSFIQKEIKERGLPVAGNNDQSQYAEVVVQNKPIVSPIGAPKQLPLVQEEKLYRLIADHRMDKSKIQGKAGDIFLSKEQEKDGQIVGILLQVVQKNNYHQNVSIPVAKLIFYTPAPQIKAKQHPPKNGNNVYVDMADLNCLQTEFMRITNFEPEFSKKPPPPAPNFSSPTLERAKSFGKDKITKLKAEIKAKENEITILAIADRKSSSKEKDVLSFKRRQIGTMLYSNMSRWWLIKLIDGNQTLIGWVPADYWRIMPECPDDDINGPAYNPWVIKKKEKSECQEMLSLNGNDRCFLFLHNEEENEYTLFLKRHNAITSFKANIMPDNKIIFSGRDFETLHNIVLVFKRTSLIASDPDCTLGLPLTFVKEGEKDKS